MNVGDFNVNQFFFAKTVILPAIISDSTLHLHFDIIFCSECSKFSADLKGQTVRNIIALEKPSEKMYFRFKVRTVGIFLLLFHSVY